MDKQKEKAPIVGGSSLLVMFAVLCLTVFALLGLSTAQADKRLSDAAADAVTGYYEADSAAEAILAEIRSGNIPEGVTVIDSSKILSYSCPISKTQVLCVEVSAENYEVVRWQAVSTTNAELDESVEVWDGE